MFVRDCSPFSVYCLIALRMADPRASLDRADCIACSIWSFKAKKCMLQVEKMELLQIKITFGTKLGLKKPSLDKALMALAWACSCCTVLLACKNSVNPSRQTTYHYY
jgi:hypothetical protein